MKKIVLITLCWSSWFYPNQMEFILKQKLESMGLDRASIDQIDLSRINLVSHYKHGNGVTSYCADLNDGSLICAQHIKGESQYKCHKIYAGRVHRAQTIERLLPECFHVLKALYYMQCAATAH